MILVAMPRDNSFASSYEFYFDYVIVSYVVHIFV